MSLVALFPSQRKRDLFRSWRDSNQWLVWAQEYSAHWLVAVLPTSRQSRKFDSRQLRKNLFFVETRKRKQSAQAGRTTPATLYPPYTAWTGATPDGPMRPVLSSSRVRPYTAGLYSRRIAQYAYIAEQSTTVVVPTVSSVLLTVYILPVLRTSTYVPGIQQKPDIWYYCCTTTVMYILLIVVQRNSSINSIIVPALSEKYSS